MKRHLLSPKVARAVAASAVGCALLALPARAHAQDASGPNNALGQGFGAQGQIVISTETSGGPPFAGFGGAHFDKVNKGGWTFEIRPAADYFVVPAVSVGAVVGFAMNDAEAKGVELGGRAGFNFNINEHLGAWGRAGVNFNHISAPGSSANFTYVPVSVMILYHFVPHFFAGIGPYYNLKLSGNVENNYGFTCLLGGWF